MKRTPATITDIAKALNISASTVSRALHNSPSISGETKKMVVELAKELNYQPNLVALSLLNKRSKTIGIIVPEITSYFFASAINGVQDMVAYEGYKLMISQSNESYEEELKLVNAMSLARVDGLMVSPSVNTSNFEHFEKLKASGTPLIIFDRDCYGFEADKVLVDDYDGAFQAVEYLIKTGCKRIAHLGGPSSLTTSKHRLNGYLDALKQNNIPIRNELIVRTDGFSSECGVEAVQNILNLIELPDAIFAVNDAVAIGAMSVIREAGLKIPEDISIVGFDDEPYSCYFNPSLTSVWQPVYDLGMLSAKILLDHFQNKSNNGEFRYEVLKPELVIRDSSLKLT
jgi:LacI family transcriptional regulator